MSVVMKHIVLDLQTNIDIAIIRINRPEVLNALNKEIMTELSQAIDIVSTDDGIKVIVITGTGERYATFIHTLLNKIENLQKPVIAAINGYALGGGCELALACDIRIASSNAKIGQTEVTIGIPPGWGGTQRLLRIVGPAKAKELIYTGKMMTAEEAERIGLVNKVVSLTAEEEGRVPSSAAATTASRTSTIASNNPSKEGQQEKQRSNELAKILNKKLLDECLSFAKEITKNSFIAVKTSKMLINKGIDVDINTGLRLEIYGWALCFAHEDRQKMMSSFLNKGKQQKKEPNFL
jgi:3-hydroxypropionyl-coenzyme A dehydratase